MTPMTGFKGQCIYIKFCFQRHKHVSEALETKYGFTVMTQKLNNYLQFWSQYSPCQKKKKWQVTHHKYVHPFLTVRALFIKSIQTKWITIIATRNPCNIWVKLSNFSLIWEVQSDVQQCMEHFANVLFSISIT